MHYGLDPWGRQIINQYQKRNKAGEVYTVTEVRNAQGYEMISDCYMTRNHEGQKVCVNVPAEEATTWEPHGNEVKVVTTSTAHLIKDLSKRMTL